MSRICIPVDTVEFSERGDEVVVKRKGAAVLTLKLPMWIRSIDDESSSVSKMAMVVTGDQLGVVPPTFRLGVDAKRKSATKSRGART